MMTDTVKQQQQTNTNESILVTQTERLATIQNLYAKTNAVF